MTFVPTQLKDYGLPDAFFSWIWVNSEKKHFKVLYNGAKVESSAGWTFDREKLLAKTLLHECAHGVLHHAIIREMIVKDPANPLPGLGAEHEQEAWFYGISVWAVLVGDHAFWTYKRKPAQTTTRTPREVAFSLDDTLTQWQGRLESKSESKARKKTNS